MKTIHLNIAAVLLCALAAGCSSGIYPVAKSGGGTYPLPVGDAAAMDALQGRSMQPVPTLEILEPADGQTIKGNALTVKFKVNNYKIGKDDMDKGKDWFRQHVHVILDNKPYKADYDENGSIRFKDLPAGTHTLTAFLARKFHLSLKNPGAGRFVTFHVESPMPEVAPAEGAPTLIYSRPKGKYSIKGGAAAHLMLDFYLVNVPNFGEDHFVVWSLDSGKVHTVSDWNPVILGSNLSQGEHTVRLKLVDKDGKVVPGPYNSVLRTFEVTE